MKISVCMCTYNGEKFIEQQLESLIKQTMIPNEIIIFDDCSNDKTIEIVNNYVVKYNNIKWDIQVNNENKGWKTNFYNAINRTTGDYIFLCDQDDVWKNDKIEKMSNILEKNSNIELLVCNPIIMHENTGKKEYNFNANNKIEKLEKNKYLTHTAYPGCTFALKKSIIKDFNNIWECDLPHDATLWKIAYLKESLYVYNYYGIFWRRHNFNATYKIKKIFSSQNVDFHYETIYLYKKFYKKINMISDITSLNLEKVKDINIMLDLRIALYLEKKIIFFIKLMKYQKYYASRKAYWLDFLALTKFNHCVGKNNEK